MSIENTESKEMRITKLEEEVDQAKEQLWELMLFGASGEEIIRVQAY